MNAVFKQAAQDILDKIHNDDDSIIIGSDTITENAQPAIYSFVCRVSALCDAIKHDDIGQYM